MYFTFLERNFYNKEIYKMSSKMKQELEQEKSMREELAKLVAAYQKDIIDRAAATVLNRIKSNSILRQNSMITEGNSEQS